MINVTFDTKHLTKIINNSVKYSRGFSDGIEISKTLFMTKLGEYIVVMFNEYVDSQAKVRPKELHHVYEWGQIGSPAARLFEIESIPSPNVVKISGRFLASESISDTATEPFIYKADAMENNIDIIVTPRLATYLKFDVKGETVFTMNSVKIENPGGDGVAGSFGRTAETFFGQYMTLSVLQPFLRDLAAPYEYSQGFSAGANGGGYALGMNKGKLYLMSAGTKAR